MSSHLVGDGAIERLHPLMKNCVGIKLCVFIMTTLRNRPVSFLVSLIAAKARAMLPCRFTTWYLSEIPWTVQVQVLLSY